MNISIFRLHLNLTDLVLLINYWAGWMDGWMDAQEQKMVKWKDRALSWHIISINKQQARDICSSAAHADTGIAQRFIIKHFTFVKMYGKHQCLLFSSVTKYCSKNTTFHQHDLCQWAWLSVHLDKMFVCYQNGFCEHKLDMDGVFFVKYTCEQSATETGGCILDVLLIMSQWGEAVVSSSACAVCTCGGLIIACRQSNMLSDAATFASFRHSVCSNKSRVQCNLCQAPFTSQQFSEQSCSCWRRLEEPSYRFHIHCSSSEGNLLKNSFLRNLDP